MVYYNYWNFEIKTPAYEQNQSVNRNKKPYSRKGM